MSVEISELHMAIAQVKGFEVYETYNEPEAAKILGLSLSTLSRLRNGGSIGFIQKSERRVGYFGFHLIDYFLAQQSCPNTPQPKDTKSETSGSQSKVVAPLGAVHGTANAPSRPDALHSSRQILMRPRIA